jgi:hypothetical protein
MSIIRIEHERLACLWRRIMTRHLTINYSLIQISN